MPRTPREDQQDDNEFLVDLLLESTMSITEIAKELDVKVNELNKRINRLGLSWAKERHKKMSRGQTALTSIVKKLLPGENILNEFHIGDKLKLDVYCPKYQIAFEYHGRQHFFYTQRFFDSRYEFEQAQKRDMKKIEICKQMGITLVVFRYNDTLTEQAVYDRIIDALRSSEAPVKPPARKSVKDSDFYLKVKKHNSEKRKEVYRKMKAKKKNGN